MNILQYAASCEANWKAGLADMTDYKPFTTFYYDLSIAEYFGAKGLIDTYKNVIKHWGKDIKYITEFCLCLNHKIWQHHETNESLEILYDDLWKRVIGGNSITNTEGYESCRIAVKEEPFLFFVKSSENAEVAVETEETAE